MAQKKKVNRSTETKTVRLKIDLWALIDEFAQRQKLSRNAFIEKAIRKAIRKPASK